MDLPEEAKKEKLIKNLQNYWRGRSKFVEGCKRENVQKIADRVFGIRTQTDHQLNKEISSLTFQELYLYYCYIERIVKCDTYLSKLLLDRYKMKRKKAMERKREAQELEKKMKQEEQQKMLDEMGKEQRWEYDIFEKHMDMEYYFQLEKGQITVQEDKILIAGLLREYWKKIGKWEGNKVLKKQAAKISTIKEILEGKK